eukprot:6459597-Ditylum_brightwellii.AAC.1
MMCPASQRVMSKSRHLLIRSGVAARKQIYSSVQAAVTARYGEGASLSTLTCSSSYPTLGGWDRHGGGYNKGWQTDQLSQQHRWKSTATVSSN